MFSSQTSIFLFVSLVQVISWPMIQGMKFRLIVLFLLPLSVQANDIYRSVDREGNVDEPDTKAELLELEELTNYEAAPLPILPIENSAPPEEAAA